MDSERAEKIVQANRLTPTENVEEVERDLDLVKKSYGSLDNLGPPSEYKPSMSLYKYVEKKVYYYLDAKHSWEEYFDSGELRGFIEKLDLRETIDEIVNFDKHFLLCLCGEYVQWGYVNKLSKRMWDISDDEGWHFQTRDVICFYCENCKRYAGMEKFVDDTHPEFHRYRWFYLPRLPKKTKLINQEELKSKRPKIVKRIKR